MFCCVPLAVYFADRVISNRHYHPDAYVALCDAFNSAARQLEKVIREKRGDVKTDETSQ
jgi:hypothetical protein